VLRSAVTWSIAGATNVRLPIGLSCAPAVLDRLGVAVDDLAARPVRTVSCTARADGTGSGAATRVQPGNPPYPAWVIVASTAPRPTAAVRPVSPRTAIRRARCRRRDGAGRWADGMGAGSTRGARRGGAGTTLADSSSERSSRRRPRAASSGSTRASSGLITGGESGGNRPSSAS